MNPLEWLGDRLAYQLEGIGLPTMAQAAARLDALERGEPISQQDGWRGYRMSPDEMVGEFMPGGDMSGTLAGLALSTGRRRYRPGRPTVTDPTRQAFPGVYKSEQDIIAEGEALASQRAEDPLLKQFFGVDRADLTAMTREAEGTNRVQVPVQNQRVVPEAVQRVTTPHNAGRLKAVLEMAAESPALRDMYGWYMMDPLLDKFIQAHGPDMGRRIFDEFNQFGSGFSPLSDVVTETKRSSLALLAKNTNDPALMRDRARTGLGGDYHGLMGTHRQALDRVMGGEFFAKPDLTEAHKTKNYYQSRMGGNYQWPTMDAHFTRMTGLPDVRYMDLDRLSTLVKRREREIAKEARKAADKGLPIPEVDREVLTQQMIHNMIKGNATGAEVPGLRQWWRDKVAGPVGMTGSPSQALGWGAFAPQTGVKTPTGAPLLEILTLMARERGAATGKDPITVLDEFVNLVGHL